MLSKHSACRGDGIFQGNERRGKKDQVAKGNERLRARSPATAPVGLFKETIIKVALIKRVVT